MHPFETRGYEHPHYVFPLSLPENKRIDIYFKTWGKNSITVPVNLWTSQAFANEYATTQSAFGMYYGIMIAMLLFNLFIAFSIRDKSYIFYSLYIIVLLLLHASLTGFGHQHLWRNQLWIADKAVTVLAYFGCFVSLQFTRNFLHTYNVTPGFDRFIRSLSYACIATGVLALVMDVKPLLLALAPFSLIWIATIFSSALICLKKGVRMARYFLFAWSCFLISVGIKSFLALGWLPSNIFTEYSIAIGSSIEVILLGIALSDKINFLNTEKKALQNEALRIIKRSSRLKDQFLATISHELRTPMNGVEGNLSLIKEEDLSRKVRLYVESADESAHDMMALIEGILDFSEIQSGTLTPQKATFDLQKSITPLLKEANKLCEKKGIKWHYENKAKHRMLLGDQKKILIILKHIIRNAIKFTSSGEVTFEITEEQHPDGHNNDISLITFSVIDTGIGIPDNQQTRIFSAFSQIDGGFTRKFGGLGIGLAICKGLSELMGGELICKPHNTRVKDKDAGNGSTFIFTLPCTMTNGTTTNTVPRPESSLSSPIKFQEARALVVEDNPVNKMVLKSILKKLGFTVATADNGKEAVDYVSAHHADIIFMDCQMPIMDGFEATEEIRKNEKNGQRIPIVAVTANALEKDRKNCLQAGMDDHLKKPINKLDIEMMAEKWL